MARTHYSGPVYSTNGFESGSAKTDYESFYGVGQVIAKSAGTWTVTRAAQADYSLNHSTADDTGILAIDISDSIRTSASKGFKLASIDVIYSIGTGALDAHSITLDKVNYANNAANTITSVPLTGSLATATQAQPYVSSVTVTTPAYNVTTQSHYIVEITANNSASSVYKFYGINLKFSRNDL